MALVAAGELDHQPQVRVDQPLLGGQVTSLDRLRKLDLLFGGKQRVAACLVVEDLEAVGGRLGCEVSASERRSTRATAAFSKCSPRCRRTSSR